MTKERATTSTGIGIGIALGALLGLLANELNLLSLISYWDDRVPWVIGAAIVGAAMWRTRLRWLLAAGVIALAAVWLVVAFTPLGLWLAKDLTRRDPLQPADAVYILGSSVQKDGEPTGEAMSRLLGGLALLQQGMAPMLVVSELPPPYPSHSQACRRIMDGLSMEQPILSAGETRNTRTEAVAVGDLYRDRGWKRVLVVTSPIHSRRACAAFEKEGMEVVCSPSIEMDFDLESLEKPDDRLESFGPIMHEIVGFWVYGRRGWLVP